MPAPGEKSAIELVQAGALDGLSREDILALAPGGGCDSATDGRSGNACGDILVTRLRDGSEVRLEEHRILALLQQGIERLEAEGVSVIALFCTGEFPDFSASVPILRPDRILGHFVASVVEPGRNRVVAVVPSPLQKHAMKEKWQRMGVEVMTESLSPYTATAADVESAAACVAGLSPDLIILDCIGYSQAVKAAFARTSGAPVVLPRTLLGRAAAELTISR
jgi:protein AroM